MATTITTGVRGSRLAFLAAGLTMTAIVGSTPMVLAGTTHSAPTGHGSSIVADGAPTPLPSSDPFGGFGWD